MTGNATKEKRLQSEKSEQRGVVDDSEARDVDAPESRGFLQPPLPIRHTPQHTLRMRTGSTK